MSNVAAGRLRHRVTLQEQVVAINTAGEQVREWEDVATVWAAIEPLSGREMLLADQVQSKVNTRIVIRSRDGVLASMRAIHGSTVYNIEAVIPDNESGQEWLTLQCYSGVSEG